MKIVIFGGTTEGRELSRFLADRGADVLVSVATEYGREAQGAYPGIEVACGRRDRTAMAELLRGAALCVDAVHPYATEAGETIRKACADTAVPYRRLLRDAESVCGADCKGKSLSYVRTGGWKTPCQDSGTENADSVDSGTENADSVDSGVENAVSVDSGTENVIYVDSAAEAASYLSGRSGNVLLANGSRELDRFAGLDPSRLFPRILPAHDSLSACERLSIPHRNIIAMQGPFSRELNEALIRQYRIAYLVTKDGGRAGGFPEKAEAARNMGATLVVIRRPPETGQSFDEIAAECVRLLEQGWQDRNGVQDRIGAGRGSRCPDRAARNRRPSCW